MQFEVRLVHAEPGRRVVEARASEGGRLLANALGEAEQAEEAEERALKRLRERLAIPLQPPAAEGSSQGSATPPRQPLPRRAAPAAAMASDPVSAPEPEASSETRQHSETDSHDEPLADPPAEPLADPPADPEDWSAELTRLDLALRRLGWGREQEGLYLERAFGHPSRARITRYADLLAYLRHLEGLETGADPTTAAVPLRRRDLLHQGDSLLATLGWGVEQARSFLRSQLAASSRSQLSDSQLLQFNLLLEGERLAQQGTGATDTSPGASVGGAASAPAA
ncbi:MAG: hypothetical protein ACKOZT_00605 [Cyanobium sp.]